MACAIKNNSPGVVNELMANLKIGIGNSMNDIGFRMPIDILKKYSNKSQDSLLNQNMMISDLNPQHILIHLNKSDFINNMLKNNEVDEIPQPHLKNSKPRIIEFR